MSLYEYERNGNAQELIGILDRSENPEIRRRAAEILGGFDDHDDRRDVIDALVRTAESADDADLVAAIVDALDSLGQDALERLIASRTGIDFEGEADWVKAKAFVRGLEGDVPELRMASANALGELGQSDAVPKLVGRFDDPDPRVRARSARACGEIADPRATDPLTGLLSDRSVGVRREAAEALGRIGNRQALQALLDMYGDDDHRVRRIAVSAFGNFDNDRPVKYLADALGDDAPGVRRAAVYSLIELLSNVPTEQSHRIRETVVDELSATEDGIVVDPLVEILSEGTQAPQRRNTAWLLGRVLDDDENRAAVDALVGALREGGETTTQFASTSLARIGGQYAEQELLALGEDESADTDARAQAVFALGKVGDDRTRERLESLIENTDEEQIRKRAFSALSKLGGTGG
ncbi:MAG: HEAT repeat domain-containing protein [Salinirussus sp.]